MIEEPTFQKIMIIDDNSIDIYVLARMITKDNLSKKILQYTNAQEALTYLKDNQENKMALPQIIFIDINMPIMSGFEFLKGYDGLSDTLKNYCKAYILSSSLDKEEISRANDDKNVIAFLAKPLKKEFFDEFNSSFLSQLVNGL